jgi:hypothetical protein
MLSLTVIPATPGDRRRLREYERQTAAGATNPRREIQVRPAGPPCGGVLFYTGIVRRKADSDVWFRLRTGKKCSSLLPLNISLSTETA